MQSSAAKCFLFTAAVFLLQLFPLTGMLLMIVAVPFWSVITVNLGFILVIADVVAGTLPRGALALPVIYFGGYFVTAGVSHIEARSLANGVSADNAAKSLPFDPNRESLFFESRGPALSAGSDFSLDLCDLFCARLRDAAEGDPRR